MLRKHPEAHLYGDRVQLPRSARRSALIVLAVMSAGLSVAPSTMAAPVPVPVRSPVTTVAKATSKVTKKVTSKVTKKTTRKTTRLKKSAVTTSTAAPVAVSDTAPVAVAAGVDPNAATTVATLPSATSTTVKPGPTTTLPPAPPPAPAAAPTRASAAGMDPYRGVGMWVDRFDWTTQWSKKAVPPVNATTVDKMAAVGVQTIYIQAAYWSSPTDVLEPDKLIPIIDRAHELGLHVVVWYLPAFQDVNTDLRKTVAIANLDVDGIDIDIEERAVVKEINERNRRLIAYSQSLRSLLPGRFISNDLVATTLLDATPNYWTDPSGVVKPGPSFWGGPFPYREIAPFYDLWMIQSYWTQRTQASGWRDGYRYTVENVNRLRANLGRADVPIQVIGGEGGKDKTINEFAGFLAGSRDAGSTGISFYDWAVMQQTWIPYFWSFRHVAPGAAADPRFPATALPPYAPLPQPVAPAPITTVIGTPVIVPGTTTTGPLPVPVVSDPTTTAAPTVYVPPPPPKSVSRNAPSVATISKCRTA